MIIEDSSWILYEILERCTESFQPFSVAALLPVAIVDAWWKLAFHFQPVCPLSFAYHLHIGNKRAGRLATHKFPISKQFFQRRCRSSFVSALICSVLPSLKVATREVICYLPIFCVVLTRVNLINLLAWRHASSFAPLNRRYRWLIDENFKLLYNSRFLWNFPYHALVKNVQFSRFITIIYQLLFFMASTPFATNLVANCDQLKLNVLVYRCFFFNLFHFQSHS